MNKTLNMILSAVILCGLGMTIGAQPPRGPREGAPGRAGDGERRGPAFERLDLAPEDIAALKELADTHRGKMEEMIKEYRESMETLQSLMRAEDSTEQQLLAAARRSARTNAQIQVERVRHFVALREKIGHEKAMMVTTMWRDRMRDEWRGRSDQDGAPPRVRERPTPGGDRPARGRPERPEQ